MGCDRLSNAVEFNQNRALVESAVIYLSWIPSRENASTGLQGSGTAKLCVSGESLGVANSAIRGNPIGFGHRKCSVGLLDITLAGLGRPVLQHATWTVGSRLTYEPACPAKQAGTAGGNVKAGTDRANWPAVARPA